ncbi:MAG: response regulator [Gammaproteobacteria bacterium]|nr:response regulator [Gammaproteobacteria bacterium]
MTKQDDPKQEADALRSLVSKLSDAVLRISASLDVDTVLREVVENARALTNARYGLIATIDETGKPGEFVISGMSEEDAQRLSGWSDAPSLFDHIRSLDRPLRLDDLQDYVMKLGLSPVPIACQSFQGTPMRHRGLDVGSFFLGEKEGEQAFTAEDEEVLVLFAAQAAIAIANARAHRDEQRARTNLETLVDTSPVGVIVFDAAAGDTRLINREAKRIVAGLLGPDGSIENLREVLTSRLSNGSEVRLEDLKQAETLRAAEVELSVPDGRSLRLLVNASPITTGDGDVESVVVTIQDLSALEELARLRVEFLGMVSHELRTPLAAIRGSAITLLEESGQLDPAESREFHRIIVDETAHMRRLVSDMLDAGRIESGSLSVHPEPRDIEKLVARARTSFISAGRRQSLSVDLAPNLPRVMADDHRIEQVLGNLLDNAARHAPASSTIHVSAMLEGIEVAVSVVDEGPGIPADQLARLFVDYADRHERERGSAGFGLGLIICKGLVEAHGGRIHAERAGPDLGTRFTFTLPVADDASDLATHTTVRGSPLPVSGSDSTSILVIDDDPEVLRHVREALVGAGFEPIVTGDPDKIQTLIRENRPDLVLLDMVLPDIDGVELMTSVPELSDIPVIFISAYGRDEMVAKALDSGADDYIVKPFSTTELAARVRAVLRRRAGAEPFVLGDLEIQYEQRLVSVAGEPVRLTPIEYNLLRVLSLNAGRVVTYASLLRQVWTKGSTSDTMRVRDFVKKLRRKLGDDVDKPSWIFNERGVGYRMPKPGED